MQRRTLLLLSTAVAALGASRAAQAQTTPTAQTAAAAPAAPKFTSEQLDQMLAPIALYPDDLLAQTLMAATYPLEVVEAARWSQANPNLKGEAAVAAVKNQGWDVSVKSLTAFPQVLAMMNNQLEWTQKIGDAMIGQQSDVAASIQRLRAKAAAAGNLKSGAQQKVTSTGSGSAQTIVIEPASPELVYVPVYNPVWAYGPWPYPAYPPYYYPPAPAYGYGAALATGFMFGVGVAAAGAMFGSWNWAGHGNNYVNVNVNRATTIDNNFNHGRYPNGVWQHDPLHRDGVPYRNASTADLFGQNRPGAADRNQFRGQLDGGQRAGEPATRSNYTQRPSGENRGGAFGGMNRGGSQINREASRGYGEQSRASSWGGRGGFGGGGDRGFGGGERGGGGRR
jgi:uncharacterized membrane protein YgcG